jgi:uncharacterized membrane protein
MGRCGHVVKDLVVVVVLLMELIKAVMAVVVAVVVVVTVIVVLVAARDVISGRRRKESGDIRGQVARRPTGQVSTEERTSKAGEHVIAVLPYPTLPVAQSRRVSSHSTRLGSY